MNRKRLTLLILLTFPLLSNCVYFNTFYNARKYFKEAQKQQSSYGNKPSQQQIDLYNKCIERCAKVVGRYKKSGYVDDALFLMGKSMLGKQEPQNAITTLEQLVESYPNSDYVDEASLLIGQAYYDLKRPSEALVIFRETIEKFPHRSFAVRAQFSIGDIFFVKEDYKQAVVEYSRALEMKSRGPVALEAYTQIGECYLKLKNYPEAQQAFARARSLTPDKKRRYDFSLKEGQCLIEIEEYDRAQQLFKNLKANAPTPMERTRLDVKIAETHFGLNENLAALEILQTILQDRTNMAAAADANFAMGRYFEKSAAYDSALVYYESAAKGGSSTENETAVRAGQKKQELQRLQSLKKITDDPEKAAESYFTLGELYLYDFQNVKQSVQHYRVVTDSFSQTSYAPKAMLALGFVYEQWEDQPDSADALFGRLLRDYSATPEADAVRTRFGLPENKRLYQIPKEPEPKAKPDSVAVKNDLPTTAAATDSAKNADNIPKTIKWPEASPDSSLTEPKNAATDSTSALPIQPGLTSPAIIDSLPKLPLPENVMLSQPADSSSQSPADSLKSKPKLEP